MPGKDRQMTIIGYAYDVAIHCLDCTHNRFQGTEDSDALDSEGNQVQPILDITEGCHLVHCDDCHEPLIAHDCDEHGRWEAAWRKADGRDEESERFQKHDDAKRWLIRELEGHADSVDSWADPPDHDCEELGHEDDPSCPRQVANQLAFLAEDLGLIPEGRTFEAVMGGVRYWIKEVVG